MSRIIVLGAVITFALTLITHLGTGSDGPQSGAESGTLYRASLPRQGGSVLEEPEIPIVGWLGPSGDLMMDSVFHDMAEAGFNVSISEVSYDNALDALEMAGRNRLRLILMIPDLKINKDDVFDKKKKSLLSDLVSKVKGHPALFGYYITDEPTSENFPQIAEVTRFIRDLDSYHVCYVNNETPVTQNDLGSGSSEERAWDAYIEMCRPRFLSSHHYVIRVGWAEEGIGVGDYYHRRNVSYAATAPNVFGKVVVKPDYFEVLDHYRDYSLKYDIPFWAFALSVRHGPYPEPTEGHLRFQLMCNLAYGARGLQYFTYAYAQAMVGINGSPTQQWEFARRVNRDIHSLWKVMGGLESIAVYHTGPVWSGTRLLEPSNRPMTIKVTGDPSVVGLFLDKDGVKYAFLVNRNPVEWGRFQFSVTSVKEGEQLTYYEVEEEGFFQRWPYRLSDLPVVLGPGEAILFRLGGTGPRRF